MSLLLSPVAIHRRKHHLQLRNAVKSFTHTLKTDFLDSELFWCSLNFSVLRHFVNDVMCWFMTSLQLSWHFIDCLPSCFPRIIRSTQVSALGHCAMWHSPERAAAAKFDTPLPMPFTYPLKKKKNRCPLHFLFILRWTSAVVFSPLHHKKRINVRCSSLVHVSNWTAIFDLVCRRHISKLAHV